LPGIPAKPIDIVEKACDRDQFQLSPEEAKRSDWWTPLSIRRKEITSLPEKTSAIPWTLM